MPRQEREAAHTKQAVVVAFPGEAATEITGNEQSGRLALLTPRERELFMLLLEGYTLKESAQRLSVKYSTVNTHMTGVYKKLNVNSRAELIIRYRDAGQKPD